VSSHATFENDPRRGPSKKQRGGERDPEVISRKRVEKRGKGVDLIPNNLGLRRLDIISGHKRKRDFLEMGKGRGVHGLEKWGITRGYLKVVGCFGGKRGNIKKKKGVEGGGEGTKEFETNQKSIKTLIGELDRRKVILIKK